MLEPALAAAEELNATVVNMRFVKPVDEKIILEMATTHDLLVTVEENVIQGGAGGAVSEVLAARGIVHPLIQYGLPDRLIQHGTREDMLKDAGLDKDGLLYFIRQHNRKSESDKKIRSL
jgi:1-deoxy-D-xylulose-5-phosphate synthase